MATTAPPPPPKPANPDHITATMRCEYLDQQPAAEFLGPRGCLRYHGSSSGGHTMCGYYWPAERAKGVVVLVHGHGSYLIFDYLRNHVRQSVSLLNGCWLRGVVKQQVPFGRGGEAVVTRRSTRSCKSVRTQEQGTIMLICSPSVCLLTPHSPPCLHTGCWQAQDVRRLLGGGPQRSGVQLCWHRQPGLCALCRTDWLYRQPRGVGGRPGGCRHAVVLVDVKKCDKEGRVQE